MHGGDIYRHEVNMDFSVNINPLGIPEYLKSAYIDTFKECTHYPDIRNEKLIEMLSREYSYDPSGIVIGNGASELITWILHILKPKKLLMPVPAFAGYNMAVNSLNECYGNAIDDKSPCEIVTYDLKPKLDYRLDDGILEEINSDIDMIIITNPNNPTGALIDFNLLVKIVEKAASENVIVVLDECFIGFCEKSKELSLKSMLSGYNNLVIIDAFTKLYAIPGVRLGFVLCGDIKIADILRRCMPEWNVSVVAQKMCVTLLDDKNRVKYLADTNKLIARERKYLQDSLTGLGAKVCPSDANFIMFYSDDKQLYDKLLTEKVLIRDCSDYGGLDKGWYRIAIKDHSENERLI